MHSFSIEPRLYEKTLLEKLKKDIPFEQKIHTINTFKDTQSYLIDIAILLYHNKNFKELSYRLSELSRVVVRQTIQLIEEKLIQEYGTPLTAGGKKAQWALFGLGKFGGSAMGYASDIEIMLIYDSTGRTDKNNLENISNQDFFSKMVQLLKKNIISKKTGVFCIDLRLRPHGDAGPLAVRLENFISYYGPFGQSHSAEKLSLTRMRPVAGNPELVEKTLEIRDNLIYESQSIDWKEIFSLRKKQIASKVKENTKNAKFSPGALVDVEYNVQLLQVQYGKHYKKIKTTKHPLYHIIFGKNWRAIKKRSTYNI